MTSEENNAHYLKVKTFSKYTMALPDNIFHQFDHFTYSHSLFLTLRNESDGNMEESKNAMLKSQY